MDLSIITVTYNSKNEIRTLLDSAKEAAQNVSFEYFVVDNGSTDETAEIIKREYPGVHLIEMGHNSGFGAANNRAARETKGDFLLFLNPDMKLERGSLDKIISWMKSRVDVGIASCKLVDEGGLFLEKAKPRRFPKLSDQLLLLLKLPHLFPKVLNSYLYSGFNPDVEQEVDSVRGSFMLMRRSLYENLGWAFDPRYFIWFEDVDICRECYKNGLKVVYTPVISCTDYLSRTFNKIPALWKQRKFTESMLRYFRKWEPWYKWIWIALFRPVGIALTAVFK